MGLQELLDKRAPKRQGHATKALLSTPRSSDDETEPSSLLPHAIPEANSTDLEGGGRVVEKLATHHGDATVALAVTESTTEGEVEFESLLETLFMRYDLDGSGDLNSAEELQQLTLSLLYKLDLQETPSPEQIAAKCATVDPPVSRENVWSQEKFRDWFRATFVPGTR